MAYLKEVSWVCFYSCYKRFSEQVKTLSAPFMQTTSLFFVGKDANDLVKEANKSLYELYTESLKNSFVISCSKTKAVLFRSKGMMCHLYKIHWDRITPHLQNTRYSIIMSICNGTPTQTMCEWTTVKTITCLQRPFYCHLVWGNITEESLKPSNPPKLIWQK